MINFLEFEYDNGQGDTDCYAIPLVWAICSYCDGEGRHSRHIGCITESERVNDWTEEEFEGYLSGNLDQTCEECKGTGKVKSPDLENVPALVKRAYHRMLREREEDNRTMRMECGIYEQ